MHLFNGYDIELTRGDSLFFKVNLDGRTLPEGSVAYFTVKETPKAEEPVIRKKIDIIDGVVDIRLSSEDTYLRSRTYYWDIRVLIPIDIGGYEVETPMEYAAFTIVDAIGFPGDDGQPPGLDENLPRLSLLIEEAREVIEELKDYQIPDEQIEQIVRDYLEENPPEAGVSKEEVEQTVSEAIADLPDWTKTENKPTYTAPEVGALPESTKIPSKTSGLTNDSGFITKAVGDLTNYYLKSETYTQAEINQRISAIPKFAISVVSALPTNGISETTVYLVKSGSGSDLYTEYIRVNGVWEVLGSQRVDLTGYATETWVSGQLSGYQPKGDYALKSELPDVPVQSVNGKTGDVKLTASDVGAVSASEVDTKIANAIGAAIAASY